MAPGLQSIALFSQIVVDHAEGCTITDVDGNEYLDFIAGIAVGSVGHSHPHYVEAPQGAARTVDLRQLHDRNASAASSSSSPRCCRRDSRICNCFSGGAEAVEAAFRLAKSVTKKFEFIGFWGGFHGKSQGVIGMLGGAYRNHQGPFPPGMHHSPYANCYRCPFNLQHPSCGLACAEHLRNVIKNDTQGELAAIIIEPMQGTAGNVIPPDDFIHAVREIATETGALLIADEILVGFGRTGKMWASDHFGVEARRHDDRQGHRRRLSVERVASSLERMSAAPFGEPSGSSSSYGGNPLAAAAGLGAVEAILEDKLVENSARVGAKMLDALKRLQDKYRFIGDVRGRGLMIGVEMVADRKTKAPLDKNITRALFHEALERGLITMSYSNVIRINPPLVITEDEALRGVDILDQSFAAIARRFNLD